MEGEANHLPPYKTSDTHTHTHYIQGLDGLVNLGFPEPKKILLIRPCTQPKYDKGVVPFLEILVVAKLS